MFDTLSGKLSGVFDRLRSRGRLSEADVSDALREVRLALLEADVALPVVKDLHRAPSATRALGAEVLDSVSPGQLVIKIVNDVLGGRARRRGRRAAEPGRHRRPSRILMVGLQGSGKTTTSGKLALRLAKRDKQARAARLAWTRSGPAAQLQLQQLGHPGGRDLAARSSPGQTPVADRAAAPWTPGRREVFDVVILDTAGRLSIDAALMVGGAAPSASPPTRRKPCWSWTP